MITAPGYTCGGVTDQQILLHFAPNLILLDYSLSTQGSYQNGTSEVALDTGRQDSLADMSFVLSGQEAHFVHHKTEHPHDHDSGSAHLVRQSPSL